MSIKVNLSVSEGVKTAFQNARNESTRIMKITISNESFELVSSEVQAGTSSIDFKRVPTMLNEAEPCIILYRDKDFTLSAPWIIVSFVPDNADVNQRMLYASSKTALRDYLGKNNFSKIKDFSTIDEVSWKNVQTVDLQSSSNEPKPWSQREVVIRDLEVQEGLARKEYMETTPTQPSGFSQVKLPMTPGAEEALTKLKNRQVSWVQLTLGDNFDKIDCVLTKNVSEHDLANSIDFTQPQFYLYDLSGSIILIYCCPEEGSNIRNRMVYSTCKATLAQQVKGFGVALVKKFDIRTKEEINVANIRSETSRKTATQFRPTGGMMRGNANFDEEANANVRSKFITNEPPQGGTAYHITGGGSNAKLPKGVVLPPPGAYC